MSATSPSPPVVANTILKVWRIENFEKVELPEEDYGTFYNGDSYIVQYSYEVPPSTFQHTILYFWQGRYSTADERGSSALLTVQMDDAMGGTPVQCRVTEGKEPEFFLNLFDGKMMVKSGGVASGFHSTMQKSSEEGDDAAPSTVALFHVKDNGPDSNRDIKTTSAVEVGPEACSLTSMDCFVLLLREEEATVWLGRTAKEPEREAAIAIAQKMVGEEKVTSVNEGEEADAFWAALGGKDDYPETRPSALPPKDPILMKCSDATGDFVVEQVDSPFSQDDLNDQDVMLLDVGTSLFIWIGSDANSDELLQSSELASKYASVSSGDAEATAAPTVITVESGSEPPLFTQHFHGWDRKLKTKLGTFVDPYQFKKETETHEQLQASEGQSASAFWKEMSSNSSSTGIVMPHFLSLERLNSVVEEKDDDYMAMLQSKQQARDAPMDDGSGTVKVWKVEDNDKSPLDEAEYGQFYDGDSYIILYTYAGGQVIYFWQGNHSSRNEKGASAILTVELDDQLGGKPVQVRVTQGKEPSHFRSIFAGKMIVHAGGVESGFRQEEENVPCGRLYQVKGTTEQNTYGITIDRKAASLNSYDSFVLTDADDATTYLWIGSNSNEAEQTVAARIADIIAKGGEVTKVKEGSESDSFWDAIGGQGDYARTPPGTVLPSDPRLFHCSNALGNFRITEVFNFSQEDLKEEDVAILDVGTDVYIWIGSEANSEEVSLAAESAKKYMEASDGHDDGNDPIITVASGSEPPIFTQWFLGWDKKLGESTFVDPLEEKKKEEEAAEAAEAAAEVEPAPEPAEEVPLAEDPSRREELLSPEEFQETFGMTLEEFKAMPKWKQVAKKKEVGLF